MDGVYGIDSSPADDVYAGSLMAAYNLHYRHHHQHHSMGPTSDPIPGFGSEELGFQCSAVSESAASANVDEPAAAVSSSVIKARIASHPSYPKLLDAYIDCQKVGAPPEIARLLDEIRREKEDLLCGHQHQDSVSMCLGLDPELDEFMETYCDVLVRYKSDLSRPFDEATSFLHNIETQLQNLCKDHDGSLSSNDEFSGGETEVQDGQIRSEDRELKDRLLRRYGSRISSLKLEFSKKKKKGKLPKEARQALLEWWNVHCKWPYPTEADKIALAESTGLDQKQINNWFINQRKRHWKPSENMQMALMGSFSGNFFAED